MKQRGNLPGEGRKQTKDEVETRKEHGGRQIKTKYDTYVRKCHHELIILYVTFKKIILESIEKIIVGLKIFLRKYKIRVKREF